MFKCFDSSTGDELGPFVGDVDCFSAGNIEKGDCGAVVGAAGTISGRPRVFFTPGTLSTVKFEKGDQKGIKKNKLI